MTARIVSLRFDATGTPSLAQDSPRAYGAARAWLTETLRPEVSTMRIEQALRVHRQIPIDEPYPHPETCAPFQDAIGLGLVLRPRLSMIVAKSRCSANTGGTTMSDQAIDAAVEKILSNPDYAAEVYENPEQALCSQFELEPGEWRSIAWSLRQDVEDSLGDVRGHVTTPDGVRTLFSLNFITIEFRYLAAVPTFKGNFDRAPNDPTRHASYAGQ